MVEGAAMRHGTNPGNQQHRRRGEDPCDLCRGAAIEYARLYRKNGALFKHVTTRARIADYMALNGARTLRQILIDVPGKRETIRRTVYRMRHDGEILYDTYTRHYTEFKKG